MAKSIAEILANLHSLDKGDCTIKTPDDVIEETIKDLEAYSKEIPTVYMSVEGGVIHGVTIEGGPVNVRVYDFDIEGVDEADLSKSRDGQDDCYLMEFGPEEGDY